MHVQLILVCSVTYWFPTVGVHEMLGFVDGGAKNEVEEGHVLTICHLAIIVLSIGNTQTSILLLCFLYLFLELMITMNE